MRKWNQTVLLLVFCGTCCLVSAQSFGIRVGGNIANQSFKVPGFQISPSSIFGLDLAILGELPVTNAFTISPELHYIQKGYKVSLFGLDDDVEAKFNYLELAVLAGYHFPGLDGFNVYPFVGPSVGYALSGKIGDEDIDFDDEEIKRLDFGVHLGAGIQLPMGNSRLFLDLRYLLGLANLADSGGEDVTIKNNGFGIGVGILF